MINFSRGRRTRRLSNSQLLGPTSLQSKVQIDSGLPVVNSERVDFSWTPILLTSGIDRRHRNGTGTPSNDMMPNVLLNCDFLPQSPMFLLFLDCVWQLTNQFPDKFEFTETYLTTLWDSCHIGVFDNFLFNSERDRRNAEMVNHRAVFFCYWC